MPMILILLKWHNMRLEDNWNYMLPIIATFSAKCILTQNLVTAKLSGR